MGSAGRGFFTAVSFSQMWSTDTAIRRIRSRWNCVSNVHINNKSVSVRLVAAPMGMALKRTFSLLHLLIDTVHVPRDLLAPEPETPVEQRPHPALEGDEFRLASPGFNLIIHEPFEVLF